jgi:N-terminal domain of anti-restriction factor ArdC
MSAKHKRQLTDDERAERRAQDREYARQAVEQLRSSDGWNAWLTARASFRNYSLGNQLLIAMARPTATRVAGFRAWLKLGYSVQKRPDDVPEGSWAIKIWAPCPPSRKQLERWQQNGANPNERPRTFFKLVPVFDRLSRVRSGDIVDSRVGLGLPAGILLRLVRAPRYGEGTGFRLARSSRSRRPEGGGAVAIARASRRYPREQRRDKQARMPTPCSQAGNLADEPFSQAVARAVALHPYRSSRRCSRRGRYRRQGAVSIS